MFEANDSNDVVTLEDSKSPAETIDVDEARAAVFMANIKESTETAKEAAREASESRRLTAVALTDAQSKLADINNASTQAIAAMTKIVDDQAVIATKSDHIQHAQIHADTVRAKLDRVLTAATQDATDAEGLKTRAQTAADNAATVLSEVRTTKGTIEGLLPGATSAGLAHALDQRRQTFLEPKRKWEKWFVGSVLAIAILTAISLLQLLLGKTTPTWDEIVLLWLSRMPVIGILVWLAIHASHEAALAKRMEEDYGYKAAIASTFLGFHQQMAEIGSAASSNAPLAKLYNDTLSTIASPPGRIYDKHKLTVSPSRELKEAAETAGEMFKAGMKPTV